MVTHNLMGVYALIPTTMLLTVSFFVLFAARKTDAQGLRVFGNVVAVLLWIAAALVFSTGMFVSSSQRQMMPTRHNMMRGIEKPAGMMPAEKMHPPQK